jgi:hypothetical protein
MARKKKKKTVSNVPVEVTVAAITVTDVDSGCLCDSGFQKQLCSLNVELGVERFCLEKGESHVSTCVEATATVTEVESETVTETEGAAGTTAVAKEDCCCELFRKLNVSLLEAYFCLEQISASKGVSGDSGAVTGAAVTESAVTGAKGGCQCSDDLEKFWCDEYLRIGVGRQCLELKRLLKKKETEENSGPVNHFKIIWHRGGVL